MRDKARWTTVALYGAAMALVEAAVVIYLRTLVDRIEPYHPDPLPVSVGLGQIELVREIATMIMLLCVGWLAGRTWRAKLAYTLIAFGVWDILYYVFLKLMGGWPNSFLDWDILFLLPLPWWGPVLAPMLIAFLMILGGTLVTQLDQSGGAIWPDVKVWVLAAGGVLLALVVFMTDSLLAAPQGQEAIRAVLPTRFNWPLFTLAVSLMLMPMIDLGWKLQKSNRGVSSDFDNA